MGKNITVCNEHETPLIWTFAFPYIQQLLREVTDND